MPVNIKSAAEFWARIKGDSATAGDGTASSAPARFDHTNSDFSAGTALSDTDANPTTTSVGAKGQVWDGTQWIRLKQAVTGSITSLVGIVNTAPIGRYNATPPTLTDGDHRSLQLDANGNLRIVAGQGFVVTTCTGSSSSITSTSGTALAANSSRKSAVFVNSGSGDIFLRRGTTAVSGQGILLKANGGSYEISSLNLYTGIVTAITTSGTSSLSIEEGV